MATIDGLGGDHLFRHGRSGGTVSFDHGRSGGTSMTGPGYRYLDSWSWHVDRY